MKGNRLKAHIVNTDDGFLVNFCPTQIGEYLLFVTFCGTPLTEPYLLKCLKQSDPTRVYATGPGLHSGIINEPAEFMIDTRAGQLIMFCCIYLNHLKHFIANQ
jgi:filamin